MARTVDVAAHERRRNQFLDAAQRLIESRGYEQMSVRDLLDEAGASRGAFYHYFEAKQDLLAAVVDRLVDAIIALLDPIAEDPDLSAREQMEQVFAALSARDGQELEAVVATLRVWYSDGNVLVRQKFRTTIIDRLAVVLAGIVARGQREGAFAVPDAQQAALVLATLLQDLNDALADTLLLADLTAAERIVEAHVWAIGRVLGIPDGSTTVQRLWLTTSTLCPSGSRTNAP